LKNKRNEFKTLAKTKVIAFFWLIIEVIATIELFPQKSISQIRAQLIGKAISPSIIGSKRPT
jgi:hypothetical protein